MKTTHLIVLLLAGTCAPSIAQRPQGPPPTDPVIEAIDKNGDKKLSSREIRNAAKSLLKLDKNKDKTLSEDELRPEPPEGRNRRKNKEEEEARPPAPPASPIFSAIDTDGDGSLSEEEIEAASESLTKLDTDENGKLDSEEAGLKEDDENGGPSGRSGPPQGGQGKGGPPPRVPRR